MLIVKYIYFDT